VLGLIIHYHLHARTIDEFSDGVWELGLDGVASRLSLYISSCSLAAVRPLTLPARGVYTQCAVLKIDFEYRYF
jgi:hypothetical protein